MAEATTLLHDRTGRMSFASTVPASRRLTLNFLLLAAGEALAKLLTFAGFVYLARVLGPADYGRLEFVLAIMVFFTLPVDFGLGTLGAREIARWPDRAVLLLCDIALLRLALALASFTVLLVVAALLPETAEVQWLLVLYGLSLFAAPALLQWFFQGHEQMHWVAVISLVRQVVFAGLIFVVFDVGMPLYYVGFFECAAVAVAAAAGLAIMSQGPILRRWPRPAPSGPRPRLPDLLRHLRQAAPIGLSELAWAFLWYFATVLVALMVGDQELGWFGVSHRVVMALHTFVWLYFFNLLPALSRCVFHDRARWQALVRGSLLVTSAGGVLLSLGVTFFGSTLLALTFGASYAAAAPALAALIWLIPLALVSGHYRYTLIAANRPTAEMICTLAAALTALVFASALVPHHGAVGAALALVIGHVVNLTLAYVCVRRIMLPDSLSTV